MKHKEIVIYLLVFLIILISFLIPKLITNIEESKIFLGTYVIHKDVQTLNEKIEKIDLVDTIYSKYHNNQKYDVQVSDTNYQIKDTLKIKDKMITISEDEKVLKKIEELVNQEIVNENFFKNLMKEKTIIDRTWDYDNGEITYSKSKIFTNADFFETAIASIEVENLTNKVISFAFQKEYISSDKSMFEKYVSYLELDTFQDWEYLDNELKSKEAGVKITKTEENGYIYVKLLPL